MIFTHRERTKLGNMFLKPKKTNLNEPAVVYRRITKVETSESTIILYKCLNYNGLTYSYFIFNKDKLEFEPIDYSSLNSTPQKIIVVTATTQVFVSGGYYFYWNAQADYNKGAWVKSATQPQGTITLADAGFANIGRYQTNLYLYAGSFQYTIKGEVVGARTQQLKGNILPLTSMNIEYYDDTIGLEVGDLVVVHNQLFSVENPTTEKKHLPKEFNIYFCTLNSVL